MLLPLFTRLTTACIRISAHAWLLPEPTSLEGTPAGTPQGPVLLDGTAPSPSDWLLCHWMRLLEPRGPRPRLFLFATGPRLQNGAWCAQQVHVE